MKRLPRKIFVVFKTHFDIGFTDLAANVTSWYSKGMISRALEICRASEGEPEGRRYIWTVPSWCLLKTLDGIEDPKVRAEAEHFVKNGQLVWHGLPFTTSTEICGLEEFSRGVLLGKKLEEKYGHKIHGAKMTDVPGHTWMLPSILAKAGITFLHLGCNECSTPPEVPRIFWWEGPDGSRIMTCYSTGGYGSGLLPPEDWEYPYWLALLHTGDNQEPQNPEFLRDLFERIERELPGVEVQVGTLQDFGDAMMEFGEKLPVVRGDMADTWIRGVGSAPAGVGEMRKIREKIRNLEAADTLLSATDGTEDSRETIRDVYEKILLFGEHTWGMDVKISVLFPNGGYRFWMGGSFDRDMFEELRKNNPGYQKLEASWKEQLAYLEEAEEGLSKLTGKLKEQAKEEKSFTVFSAVGHEYVGTVELEGMLPLEGASAIADETGNLYPVYEKEEGVAAADLPLPALGSRVFTFSKKNFEKTSVASREGKYAVLENGRIRIRIDQEKGWIVSFYDKKNRKEWFDPGKGESFGSYRYDVYSGEELVQYLKDYCYDFRDWGVNDLGKNEYPRWQKHLTAYPRMTGLKIRNTEVSGIVTWHMESGEESREYGDAEDLEFSISLKKDADYADLTVKLNRKHPTPFLESGYLSFPMNVRSPRWILNKMGCVLEPERDILPGCNQDLYCMDRWMAVEDGNAGIAFFAGEMPLCSIGEPGVLKFSRTVGEREPVLMMQLFNNTWGTNYPQWIEGNLRFSYRLAPYEGNWREAKIPEKAGEFQTFPAAVAGTLRTKCLLPKSLPDMNLLALKKAEDGKGWILRLCDSSGLYQRKCVVFGDAVHKIWSCSLTEEKQGELPIRDKKIEFDSAPFEIHTLYVEIEQK